MAFDPPSALLPVLQCLHALSFGAAHLGALGFVARLAPAMGLSGFLYARWGSLAYSAMALAAILGGLFVLAGHRLAREKAVSA